MVLLLNNNYWVLPKDYNKAIFWLAKDGQPAYRPDTKAQQASENGVPLTLTRCEAPLFRRSGVNA
jgi:hypothetical protein